MARDGYGFLLTGDDLAGGWPLERPPFSLETSIPGVFAAGDVRHGSVKRVAAAVGEGATRRAARASPARRADRPRYLKMLTARAVTSSTVMHEIADSESMSSLAQRLSGIASVGLKAIEFVNETYR